jgi:putative MATE family efflux protein
MTNRGALLDGPPWKAILRFIVPVWVGNVVQQSYYTADAVILGRFVGADGLAAVGSSFGLIALLVGMLYSFTAGLAIQFAQAWGAQDHPATAHLFWRGLRTSGILAVGVGAILILAAPAMLTMLGVPTEIRTDALTFYIVFCVGMPITALGNFCTHALRGLGDSTGPTLIMLASGAVNVLLALWFVGALGLGVWGSALATQGAGLCTAAVSLVVLLRRHAFLRERSTTGSTAGRLQVRQGGALALQSSGIGLGNVLLQTAANSLGPTTIAGVAIGLRVEGAALAPLAAFGICMVVFCAQNLGAGDRERVRRGVNHGAALCVGVAIVVGVVVFGLAEAFAAAFMTEANPRVIADAATYLRVSSVFYPVVALVFVLRASLNGVSMTRPAIVSGVGELAAKGLCAGVAAAGGGLVAVSLSGPASWILGLIPLLFAWFTWRREAPKA